MRVPVCPPDGAVVVAVVLVVWVKMRTMVEPLIVPVTAVWA
jgi:hypothetical protein